MTLVVSNMLELDSTIPAFSLPNTVDNTIISTEQFAGQRVLIAFICNHCPYVVHLANTFAQVLNDYQQKGIAIICISSNDITSHPADAPEHMAAFATQHHFTFPYCYDETQQVAKDFKAACTPDLFLFNNKHRLYYRGRFDGASPGNDVAVTGQDLIAAMDALLSNQPAPAKQTPSRGCNIKWKTADQMVAGKAR